MKTNYKEDTDPFVIGWIGTQVTAPNLDLISPSLLEIMNHRSVDFVSIGPTNLGEFKVPWKIVKWSEESEVDNICSFDVGIMPLQDGFWERGKCAYKLIQYMACGIPVIASPVGANKNIVEHNKTGILASTKEDWIKAINTFIDDPVLAKDMGAAGRTKVENELCLQVTQSRMAENLERAAQSMFLTCKHGK